MNRRNGKSNQVVDFLTAFNQTLGTVDKVAQDFELGKIANEKPVESTGFTADQGAQLDAAAKSGQYDIGYDDGAKAYTVTPKADPTQTGRIPMQGVTDFMGKRTAGAMDETQVANARQRAMAGVVSRSDPIQGARMLRDVTQGEREDKRFGWESARGEREGRLAKEADSEKALLGQVDADVGDWFKQRLTGPDGTERAPSVDDHLAASQFRASRLMASGKADAAGQVMRDHNAQSLVKIQLESAQRNEAIGKTAAAAAAGDLGAVKDFYNQYVPDGARVTDVQRGSGGQIVIQRATMDGRPMPPTTLKDTGQMLAALTTFKDPMALYNWSQNEFKNTLALNADRRAGNADARAAGSASESRSEKAAKAEAGVALFKERNPGASSAEVEAVRRGVLEPTPTADKNAPSEVKLAKSMVDAGLAPDMRTALEMAVTKKSMSPTERFLELMKPQGGLVPDEKQIAPVMESVYGADWRQRIKSPGAGGAGKPKALQNVSAADITATAKKHGISEDEVKRRLGMN